MIVGAGDRIEVRHLETARAIGDAWLVTAGLKDGDRVVVEGVQKIRPGSVVRAEEYVASTPARNSAGAPAATPKPAAAPAAR